MTTSNALRQQFLDFFAARGHNPVASSPLVPGNDPTLLFTNAGMVQFKDVFLGRDTRAYQRATSSQRCVRAGGKHNDLENVGYTARHHTFFEMLGNFSFGDYFKRDAITYAWEFLTQELSLPPEKLWITVFEEDQDAADIWLNDIGVNPEQFSRIGAKDNFWSMGDTGPCGPCTEIFYDHGPHIPGGPPGTPEEDGDRYIEIWNLVFMQYDRAKDGSMTDLPKPSVDTGMGLERLAAVLQGVHSNYEIDLFQNLITAIANTLGVDNNGASSLNVIADHIRSSAFLIVDGVLPGNEGRGYVLRRIIRRAIRHGYKLAGSQQPFFAKLVQPLVNEMGAAYPELAKAQAHVERVLQQEESRFAETLDQGMRLLETALGELTGNTIPGDVIFKLYDTYGFPVDLTGDIARERGLTLDETGFETAMNAQRERARAGSQFGNEDYNTVDITASSEFTGYEHHQDTGKIVALLRDGQSVDQLHAGERGAIVLDQTPFYAESGGQAGDAGQLTGNGVTFIVNDTQKHNTAHTHIGELTHGQIKLGDTLTAEINTEQRQATALNHSATHLLHAALRELLGEHVQQKGSLVDAKRLRFDFAHYEPISAEQITALENLVNAQIRHNQAAETQVMAYDDAIESGAMALFGEKYSDDVRVLKLGAFSTELCGGTHVNRVGDIGLFKITHETGVAAGIRRIEAVTGDTAMAHIANAEAQLNQVAAILKSKHDQLPLRVSQLVDKTRQLEKEIGRLQQKLAGNQSEDLINQAVDIDGLQVITAVLDNADADALRETIDKIKDKEKQSVIVLASTESGKTKLAAGVAKGALKQIHAGKLISKIAAELGGKGGGRPDMAQAGAPQTENLALVLQNTPQIVATMLANA